MTEKADKILRQLGFEQYLELKKKGKPVMIIHDDVIYEDDEAPESTDGDDGLGGDEDVNSDDFGTDTADDE